MLNRYLFKNRARCASAAMIAMFVISVAAHGGGVLYVDDDAPPGGDGTSWNTAYRFLQDGLTDACGGGIAEIRVGQGTYATDRDEANPDGTGDREATFQLCNGVALMGGYAGFGTKNPDDRDTELYETILSGDLNSDDLDDFVNNDENSYHVVTAIDINDAMNTALDGLTVTGGNANGLKNAPHDRGGGMYSENSSVAVNECLLSANAGGTPLIIAGGGGIYMTGGTVTLMNSTFLGNKAVGRGGAMHNQDGNVILTRCDFISNSADGPDGDGGGMSITGGIGTVTRSVFIENTARFGGGGVCNAGGELALTNCLLIGNSSDGGGGVANKFGGVVTITNCTLVSNSGFCGGGILDSNGLSTAVTNCIVWGNFGGIDPEICGPAIVTYSDVAGGYDGVGNVDADPLFVDPVSDDYHLCAGSPCIDAGDNTAVPKDIDTDLDGNLRFVDDPFTEDSGVPSADYPDDIVDMGAYEFSGPTEAAITLVVRRQESMLDTVTTLPPSDSNVIQGEMFVVELWATDPGIDLTGLVSIYVDLAFTPGVVEAISIDHRPPFTGLPEGQIDNVAGTIIGLGGSDLDFGCTGIAPDWVRVAVVQFEAICNIATTDLQLSASPNEVSGCGVGAIDPCAVNLGASAIDVICVYDLDGSGFINAGDLGLFGGCWLTGTGDPGFDPDCDFDCSGFVAGGDLGWFAAGWLMNCADLTNDDLPPCRQCGGGLLGLGPANVQIGWRILNLDVAATRAGEPIFIELLVRDETEDSAGLTTVYVDLTFDRRQVAIEQVQLGDTYVMFPSGEVSNGRIDRLGGATLAPGAAVHQWTRFALVRMSTLVDLRGEPTLRIKPSFDGVAGRSRGTIPDDQIHVMQLRDRDPNAR